MTSRQLCAFYYTDGGDSSFTCKKCGCRRKQVAGMGFSNLLSNLSAKHPVPGRVRRMAALVHDRARGVRVRRRGDDKNL